MRTAGKRCYSHSSPRAEESFYLRLLQGGASVPSVAIRIFFHPDFTVGSGVTPDLPKLADFTAGREIHPALKFVIFLTFSCYCILLTNSSTFGLFLECFLNVS